MDWYFLCKDFFRGSRLICLLDKNLYIPPDVFTPREFVEALNDALEGKTVVELKEVDEETFARSRNLWPGAEELWTKCVVELLRKSKKRKR